MAVLQDEGIGGVRVEPLALRLKVTKGSFYWHFKDRAALHDAMLEHWQLVGTRAIAESVEKAGGSARARLRRLMGVATTNKRAHKLETAMRGWARHDPKVAAAIAAADRVRIDYVSGLLREMGVGERAAELRSRILYLALIGSYFSAAQRVASGPDVWREIEALIT